MICVPSLVLDPKMTIEVAKPCIVTEWELGMVEWQEHSPPCCSTGSIPRPGVICGMWVGMSLLQGFLYRFLGFPPSTKTNISTFHFKPVDKKNHLMECARLNPIVIINIFIIKCPLLVVGPHRFVILLVKKRNCWSTDWNYCHGCYLTFFWKSKKKKIFVPSKQFIIKCLK